MSGGSHQRTTGQSGGLPQRLGDRLEIIPAIDLRNGRVVRLVQGDPSRETRYSQDPAGVAREWERRGARRLHVVDLDGALVGAPANQAGLREILRAVRVPVQVGGGLRTLEALAAALDLGASVGIVGTAAIRDPKFLEAACRAFPGRIALTLDARKGMLSVAGWAEASSCRATDLARETTSLPLAAVIYTDIQRDGTLHGPDLDGLGAVTDATDIPVIASGGIASASDIHALRRLRPGRVVGAILGRALYDGGLTLEAALAAAEAAC